MGLLFNSISTTHAVPLKSCIYVSQRVIISTYFIQTLVLKDRTSKYCAPTCCALHREKENTREKRMHVGDGKNCLLLPNWLIWRIANENVFSPKIVTEIQLLTHPPSKFRICRVIGWFDSCDLSPKEKDLGLIPVWRSWLGHARMTPISVPRKCKC